MSTIKASTFQDLNGVERYMARAWVNFNGTGTVAIRAAGNVSSITDNGVGDWTINFASPMPDANFCAVMGWNNGTADIYARVPYTSVKTVNGLRILSASGDASIIDAAVFR